MPFAAILGVMLRIPWPAVLVAAVVSTAALIGWAYLSSAVAAEPPQRHRHELPAPAPPPPSQTVRVY